MKRPLASVGGLFFWVTFWVTLCLCETDKHILTYTKSAYFTDIFGTCADTMTGSTPVISTNQNRSTTRVVAVFILPWVTFG